MRLNILFGGKAGQGPNILTHVLGEALVKQGYYVFYSRDYQSLIRGGHNFNVLTFSDTPVHSNDSAVDVIVALDDNTVEIHKKDLKPEGKIISGKEPNMFFAGKLFKMLCLDFKILDDELKALEKKYDENIAEAKEGYEAVGGGESGAGSRESKVDNRIATTEFGSRMPKPTAHKQRPRFVNGNQALSHGAIQAGLDIYFAYPMTPATPVLGELAEKQVENNYLVYELENELAVINAAIGSAITGAKAMVGTSGGGFDLMTEAISLTGIAGVPLVIYLSQRPGPGTGVATYTSQGDLNIARHAGHGEFNRVVLAGGDPKDSEELTSQAFYFSQKFKIPVIVISDKHLGESFYTVTENSAIAKSEKSTSLKRYNSYEVDETGSATENARIIKKNIDARLKIGEEIKLDAEKFEQFKVYGNKNSDNVIVSWGSPKGAILDAIKDLDVKFIQILYIEPFAQRIKEEIEGKNLIIIENNSTGQLQSLIGEKTGINIDNKILRYDGRPFLADELRMEIEKRI